MEISRVLPSCRTALRTCRAPTHFTCIKRAQQSPRCLHSGIPKSATPVNYPNVAGPPPQPPQALVGQSEELAARKRRQAELVQRGQALKANPSKPASALQKRFWKEVSIKEVDDGLQIMLDSRPVRLAPKQILTLPHSKRALATGIAMEWDTLISAQQALKHHYIPLTSLTSRAMDISAQDADRNPKVRDEIIKMMMRYLSTDTLLCWAPEKNQHDPTGLSGAASNTAAPKKSLRQKQKSIAEPIIAHLKTHVFPGVEIEPILDEDSIMPRSQPEMTQQIIKGWLLGLPAWELAALERGVLATKSLLVATRLLVEWSPEFKHLQTPTSGSARFGIKEAAEASTTEVTWQTDMWGEVEDTHDVEKEDMARQLGSVILLVG